MKTLQEMLNAIDDLPWEDVQKLEQRIDARRQRESDEHEPARPSAGVMAEIAELLAEAKPADLERKPLDVDGLLDAFAELREGISPEEFAEIERAMNEEYIEPPDELSN
jgi:hypothetical protein